MIQGLRAEGGAIALEMGIMLIAPILVAATIGAGVMRVGDVASRDIQLSVLDAIQGVGSGLQANGMVLARTDGSRITHLLVDVTTTAGSSPLRLDPGAAGRTTVSYVDAEAADRDVPYGVRWITGDGDDLLESGELAQLDIDMTGVPSRERFTVEIRPARGVLASLDVELPSQHSLPPVLRLD